MTSTCVPCSSQLHMLPFLTSLGHESFAEPLKSRHGVDAAKTFWLGTLAYGTPFCVSYSIPLPNLWRCTAVMVG